MRERAAWSALVTTVAAASVGGAFVVDGHSVLVIVFGAIAFGALICAVAILLHIWPFNRPDPHPAPLRTVTKHRLPLPDDFAARIERDVEHSRAAEQAERARRSQLLTRLHAELVAKHGGYLTVQVQLGTAPMPKRWVEQRLDEMGESWRRDEYWLP